MIDLLRLRCVPRLLLPWGSSMLRPTDGVLYETTAAHLNDVQANSVRRLRCFFDVAYTLRFEKGSIRVPSPARSRKLTRGPVTLLHAFLRHRASNI